MYKAQLLAGAEIQQIGKNPCPLRARAILKVLADFGKEKVFVVGSVAPVGLIVRRAR